MGLCLRGNLIGPLDVTCSQCWCLPALLWKRLDMCQLSRRASLLGLPSCELVRGQCAGGDQLPPWLTGILPTRGHPWRSPIGKQQDTPHANTVSFAAESVATGFGDSIAGLGDWAASTYCR